MPNISIEEYAKTPQLFRINPNYKIMGFNIIEV